MTAEAKVVGDIVVAHGREAEKLRADLGPPQGVLGHLGILRWTRAISALDGALRSIGAGAKS